MCERRETTISCLSPAPNWGPDPQSRRVPGPGIELAVHRVMSTPLSHTSQGGLHAFNQLFTLPRELPVTGGYKQEQEAAVGDGSRGLCVTEQSPKPPS